MEWHTSLRRWREIGDTWKQVPQRIHGCGQEWVTSCMEMLFPPICLVCGQAMSTGKTRICSDCHADLTDDGTLRCQRCAKPLPKYCVTDGRGCPLCRNKRLRFEQAIALGTYGDALRKLVLRIKQPRHESLCLAVGELLADRIRFDLAAKADVVVPVPMHWLRKIVRGVNDAEVLAEAVSAHLKIPFSTRLLSCRRSTRKQGTLLPTERRRNVRSAFGMQRRAKIEGRHILVIDDVMTTGATANELAKVLLRAGASRVSIAVVARGVGFD